VTKCSQSADIIIVTCLKYRRLFHNRNEVTHIVRPYYRQVVQVIIAIIYSACKHKVLKQHQFIDVEIQKLLSNFHF